MALREKCPYSKFFWFIFSRIRTEYGLNLERYSVSLRIQSECGKIRTGKTPDKYTFYTEWVKSNKKMFEDFY